MIRRQPHVRQQEERGAYFEEVATAIDAYDGVAETFAFVSRHPYQI